MVYPQAPQAPQMPDLQMLHLGKLSASDFFIKMDDGRLRPPNDVRRFRMQGARFI